ncbi:MAG: YceI family protein [Bacteroidetes bacterium]|jgi:polyisoprenoid-binding protein YceI|nr:YceI family protein [Bacteroidota bacterium]MBT5528505.1 YceI family protein [Cytophagia bacterium]MBT3423383.1 YceI family protein [Bacteroidota bacterium]MBT3799896.1 YceI family protein [Bacteroidota bacterium]MBT3934448.1 YceI family protein [Bacteroidota bacterium]
MKTKHLTFVLAIAIAFVVASCNNKTDEATHNHEDGTSHEGHDHATAVEAISYAISLENSKASWSGNMIGVYSHEGDLLFSEGELSLADGKVTAGSFTVDMTTMITTDADALYKMASREDLIGHLSNDDFFSVATYPTASFVVKSHEGSNIVGDLTIKGVTNEETLTDVVITENEGTISASGNLVFDRQVYNVSYKHTMSDMVLSDDIKLSIVVEAK